MKYALVLALAFLTISAVAQTIGRKVVFREGQQFEMVGSKYDETIFTTGGQERELTMEMDITMLVTVVRAGDTSTVLDITLTRRQMRIKAMGTEQYYDSDSAHHRNDPSIGKPLMEGIGEKNQLVVDRSGVVTASDRPVSHTGDGKAVGVGSNFELVAPLPNKPLSLGSEWSDTLKTGNSLSITNFKLVSIEKGLATVKDSGTTAISGKEINNGVEGLVNTKGANSGSFTYDIKTGILKKNSITVETSGTITIQGREIPMRTKKVSSLLVRPLAD